MPSPPRDFQRRVKAEFAQHAKEETEHMNQVAERINQLGGKPISIPQAWRRVPRPNMARLTTWSK